jgi:hypothetical protein
MARRKGTALYRKLKIEQLKLHKQMKMNSGVPEG